MPLDLNTLSMKRRLSDSDIQRCSDQCAKRHKAHCSAPLVSYPSNSSSQTFALTEEALDLFQRSLLADDSLEGMSAPPMPRGMLTDNRGRAKRSARSLRSPSPSRKPSPQTYRTCNLLNAQIFVDDLLALPSAIDDAVRHILGISSWDEQPTAPEQYLHSAATWYQAESQRNTRDVSMEGDWRFSLFGLLRQLSDPWVCNLKAQSSDKVWNSDLKPKTLSLGNRWDEESNEPHAPLMGAALPVFYPNDAPITTLGSRPVPYLPPSTAPTTSTQAADPYYISTPKPDITVGLAHTGFTLSHQRLLVNHQASASIISDPHTAYMGLRYPFLVAETKGQSANGTLVGAQNQAAISGASMLIILQDLANQVKWNTSSTADSESTTLAETPMLCFSIVTAGPTHEVFVHFKHQDAFHMQCLRSCRTTHQRDAREFVYYLHRILQWGGGSFKKSITRNLDRVPR